ncbi:hypothetical protein Hanom_Chr11g00986951 [Helianthus anomalus]
MMMMVSRGSVRLFDRRKWFFVHLNSSCKFDIAPIHPTAQHKKHINIFFKNNKD